MNLFERVDNLEFQCFLDEEFDPTYKIQYLERQKTMKKIYLVMLIVYSIIGISLFVLFWYLRNWYIIRQRNFKLTFINGILAFLSGFVTLLVQLIRLPCLISLYTSDVINPIFSSMFLSRSLRIVLLYHFNIFKVTSLKKDKRKAQKSSFGEKEPNVYLPKIYKKVNCIIYIVIAIPSIIALICTAVLQVKNLTQDGKKCGLQPEYATNALKSNEIAKLFLVAQVFGMIMAVTLLIMLIFLCKVKDNSKYGAKFECISTILLIVIITIINILLNKQINTSREYHISNNMPLTNQHIRIDNTTQYPLRILIKMYDYTKGGRVLYFVISSYMILSSILLPCIKCWQSKMEKNKYFHEPTSSIQYFYKVLNSQPLVEELKTIAIKEFSVENVLFWENYQILQKMVYRYQIEYKKAERIGNPRLVSQYDFEGYYQQQLQTFSVSSMEEYSYDPNIQVPREIMPYYINFYHTFIDSLSPASVNISGISIKHIYNELCTYPTVGMFDNAKNEIVETMFSSIFPILLRQNRKHLQDNIYNY